MAVDTNIIISTNLFAGFQNYKFTPVFSNSLDAYLGLPPNTSVNLTAGSIIGPIPCTIPLNNSNAVSIVTIQYQGLDNFTRLLPGVIAINYPNATSAKYQLESYNYYSGGNLIVDTIISNQTGSTVTIPPITIACWAGLYQAPF